MTQFFFFRVIQVSARRAKTLLARAGEIKRTRVETDPSKGKGKEIPLQNLKAQSTIDPPASQTGSKDKEPESGVKGVGEKIDVDGKGVKVVSKEKKDGGEPVKAASVDISKGGAKTKSPGEEKKGNIGQDTKKPRGGALNSSGNVTRSAVVGPSPGADTATTATDKKEDTTKEKTTKPKEEVELFVTDEGDFATPRRVTKELPPSPSKSPKEKVVPTLGLTVPKSPKTSTAPPSSATVTGSSLSPLQKVLEDTEDETLMERMARLEIGTAGYQPPKGVVPSTQSDLESDFGTAPSGPSTPKSRAEKSFNLVLRSDIPLSDDDDFFLDCDSNASVSHFDGL